MKNKKLLILPILMAGMSLSACDLGMGTMGLAKISNYSNEVSYSKFAPLKRFVIACAHHG